MTLAAKKIEDLMPDDFSVSPVWEYVLELEVADDMLVRPVVVLPVTNLANRIVGTRVRLANGTMLWAELGNLDLQDPPETRRCLMLSLLWGNQWAHFFPRHDFGQKGEAAASLASTLGLPVDDIFPIAYDVSDCCVGNPEVVRGSVEAIPPD